MAKLIGTSGRGSSPNARFHSGTGRSHCPGGRGSSPNARSPTSWSMSRRGFLSRFAALFMLFSLSPGCGENSVAGTSDSRQKRKTLLQAMLFRTKEGKVLSCQMLPLVQSDNGLSPVFNGYVLEDGPSQLALGLSENESLFLVSPQYSECGQALRVSEIDSNTTITFSFEDSTFNSIEQEDGTLVFLSSSKSGFMRIERRFGENEVSYKVDVSNKNQDGTDVIFDVVYSRTLSSKTPQNDPSCFLIISKGEDVVREFLSDSLKVKNSKKLLGSDNPVSVPFILSFVHNPNGDFFLVFGVGECVSEKQQ